VDIAGQTVGQHSSYNEETIGAFDDNGNVTLREFSNRTYEYAYDDLDQLVSEKNHNYAYDSHFNRLRKDEEVYQVDALNRLSASGDVLYDYDLTGNPLSKQEKDVKTSYVYDAFDRLISLEEEAQQRLTFTYDAWHRRLSKTVFTWDGRSWKETSSLFFLYDGENEIGAYNAQGELLQLRVLGKGRGAEIGASVAIELQDKVYAPLHDLFGNIHQIVSLETKETSEYYFHSSFGEESVQPTDGWTRDTSLTRNPWRFSSKRVDDETHLVFFGRRYYVPSTGRWLTPDPEDDIDGPNLYMFVRNNPMIYLYHFGLFTYPYGGEEPYGQNMINAFKEGARQTVNFMDETFHHPRFQGTLQAVGGFSEAGLGALATLGLYE
jgi:RHS repeat-associated protein